MAEETEPLEVLSVGIEADISALVEGAQVGVEQATQELERIPAAQMTVDTKPAVHSLAELSNAFADLPLSVEKSFEIITQGSREGATEVERLATTLTEMKQIPSFGLHFFDLQESLGLSNELLEETLNHMAGLAGVTADFDTQSVETFERQIGQLLETVSRITLSADDMNQLIQQGMEENATVTERWGAVMAEYLQEELAVGDYSSTKEALGEVVALFCEMGGLTPEILKDVEKMVQLMQQFPEAVGGWDLGPVADNLGGVERQLGVVLKSQEFLNQAVQDGTDLRGKSTEGLENFAMLLQRASMTQPQFEKEPWYLWEEATNRVAAAMSELEATQADMDQVVQAGTQEDADAYSQMAAAIVQASRQTDLSLDNVVFKMMEMGMISRESGLEIAKVFESTQAPIAQTAEAYYELVTLLHHRPAVGISEAVARSGAEVHATFGDLRADAESVLELWGLMAEAGSVVKFEVEGKDAVRHLDNLQQVMADTGLIGESTVFTLKELADVPLGPKMAAAVPDINAIAEGLSQVKLTAEQVEQVLSQRFWSGAHEQAARLVADAQEYTMDNLGAAAQRLHAATLAGLEPLQGALEILREIGDVGTGTIDEVVAGFKQLSEIPMDQIAGLFGRGLEENASIIDKLTGTLLEYAQVQHLTLDQAAESLMRIGALDPTDAAGILSFLEGIRDSYRATAEETMAFADAMATAEMARDRTYGEAAGEGARDFAQAVSDSSQEAVKSVGGVVEVFHTLTEQMLHARPAAVLAASFRQMGEEVTLTFNDIEASGKSMLELLSLGVPGGGEVKFTVNAENAVETLAQVEQALIAANLITEEATHSFGDLSGVDLQPVADQVNQLNQATDQTGEAVSQIGMVPLGLERLAYFVELAANSMGGLHLTFDQLARAIREGSEEGATALQKMLGVLLEYGVIEDMSPLEIGQMMVEDGELAADQLEQVKAHLVSLGDTSRGTEEDVNNLMMKLGELWASALTEPELTAIESLRTGTAVTSEQLSSLIGGFDQLNLTIGQMNAVLENAEATGASWAQMVANEMVAASQMLDQSLGEVAQQALKGVGGWEGLPIEPGRLQEILSYLESISAINFGATDDSIARMNKRLSESHAQAVILADGLGTVAKTHINPSPLRESIDNIIERLGVLIEQTKQVVYDLTKIGQTPVGLSDKMFTERLGEVKPEVEKSISLINRLRSAINDLVSRGQEGFQNLISSLVGTQQAFSAASLSAEQMNQAMQAGAAENATSMERLVALVVRLSESSGESFQSVVSGMVESGGITKQIGGEVTAVLGKMTGATGGLSGAIGSLGSIASGVFGGVLGVLGISTLKKLITKLREVTKQTIAYQAALTRLSVGVRAAQRLMGLQVGTIEGWKTQIVELGKVYVNFSRVALTQATSQLIMLTREMRLNEDEMGQVLQSAMTLASIYQIDLRQAINLVVQGMTGMSRGLRRYGVFLSRAALNQEAYRMGLEATWREMDVNERATVALSLITQQTTPMVEDLGVMFKTLAGRMQTATARTEDAKTALGRLAAPLEVIVKEVGASFLEWLGKAATALVQVVIMLASGGAALKEFGAALLEGVGIEKASERAYTAGMDLIRVWSEAFALWGPGLADIENAILGIGDEFDEQAQELLEMAKDYGAQIEDAMIDYHRAVEEAGIKLKEKLEDQARDLQQDLIDAYTEYRQDLEDLQREYDRKLEDLVTDNTDKLEELEREYELRRIKLRENHWNALLKLQEKYQMDSTRLRRRFIESLKEAIAKRDVWAAINAIRKYRTDRMELKEDYDLKRTQAERDFQLRMAQLERQLAEARRKILEDQGGSLEELDRWLKQRREELALEYKRELEDIHLSDKRKREEFQRAYQDQLEDLETNLERRLVKIARGMADEEEITRTGARTVFDILNSVFGLGGSIDQMMAGFEARLARRIEIDIAIREAWEGAAGGAPQGTPGSPSPWPSYQQGGAMVATRPTIAQFGEVPELVTFTPLKDLDQQTETTGVLQIQVTADEYFSIDFERRVEESIVAFVGSVVK